MRIDSFLDNLRAKGVLIFLEGGKIKYDAPKQFLTDDFLLRLKSRKSEILEYLSNPKDAESALLEIKMQIMQLESRDAESATLLENHANDIMSVAEIKTQILRSENSTSEINSVVESRDVESTSLKSSDLRQTVNQFIRRGVAFYPSESDAEVENSELLTQSEKEFLTENKDEVLYLIQRASIMRFCDESEKSEFLFEIRERESLGGGTSAIWQTTQNYFAKIWG